MNFIFDLDGTLLDTKTAVILAYDAAGYSMDEDRFGKTADQLQIPPAFRARKAELYPGFIPKYVKPLGMFRMFQYLPHPMIITGASKSAVDALKVYYPELSRAAEIDYNMSLQDKIGFLMRTFGETLYFDDDHSACDAINREVPKCKAIKV